MKIEKLKKLADALRTQVPKKQFDITIWAKQNGLFCGCAIGWAAKLELFDDLYLPKTIPENRQFVVQTPYGNNVSQSILEIFEITSYQCEQIFYIKSYDGNPKPKQVADRIEEVINGQV